MVFGCGSAVFIEGGGLWPPVSQMAGAEEVSSVRMGSAGLSVTAVQEAPQCLRGRCLSCGYCLAGPGYLLRGSLGGSLGAWGVAGCPQAQDTLAPVPVRTWQKQLGQTERPLGQKCANPEQTRLPGVFLAVSFPSRDHTCPSSGLPCAGQQEVSCLQCHLWAASNQASGGQGPAHAPQPPCDLTCACPVGVAGRARASAEFSLLSFLRAALGPRARQPDS